MAKLFVWRRMRGGVPYYYCPDARWSKDIDKAEIHRHVSPSPSSTEAEVAVHLVVDAAS